MSSENRIVTVLVHDVRFPTSLEGIGADAVHVDPDYSCAYVTLITQSGVTGHGLAFTIGRGTNIVCEAIRSMQHLIIGQSTEAIFNNFRSFWFTLTQEPQLRWLGPEKGVTHLAVSAIVNAIWDLLAKLEEKPMWRFLVDMDPERLVSCLPFTYISDVLSPEEAINILKEGQEGKEERVKELEKIGYPASTVSAGWLSYSDEVIAKQCKEAMAAGFKRFKIKVGQDKEDDVRRLAQMRKQLGDDKILNVDANQCWGIEEAIDWMVPLAKYNLTYVEEPTSPDDILGHATIARALEPYGIKVLTGEFCQNRVMFKQFLQAKALQYCQIDACRLGGPNEILTVYLMAKKFGVPVIPHAGGVGLCEYVQHLQIFDYCVISISMEERMIGYASHLHEHFVNPVNVKNGVYLLPTMPGYGAELKQESLYNYEYPNGRAWQDMFEKGLFKKHL